jgi:hypothetical protein
MPGTANCTLERGAELLPQGPSPPLFPLFGILSILPLDIGPATRVLFLGAFLSLGREHIPSLKHISDY